MARPTSSSGAARKRLRSMRIRCGRCTQRSWSWLWPTILCPESSSRGPASEAGDDRQEPPEPVGRGTMPPAVDLAVVVLLRTDGRDGHEPRPHGCDRQAVPRNTVLGRPADGVAPAERGPCCELQAYPATDAAYALDADLPKARHQQTREGAQDLALSVGWTARGTAQSGLVRRHHLPADAARLLLSGCHHGLANPEGAGLADLQHAGSRLLRRSAEQGYPQVRPARDHEYRSRIAVHILRLD